MGGLKNFNATCQPIGLALTVRAAIGLKNPVSFPLPTLVASYRARNCSAPSSMATQTMGNIRGLPLGLNMAHATTIPAVISLADNYAGIPAEPETMRAVPRGRGTSFVDLGFQRVSLVEG